MDIDLKKSGMQLQKTAEFVEFILRQATISDYHWADFTNCAANKLCILINILFILIGNEINWPTQNSKKVNIKAQSTKSLSLNFQTLDGNKGE